MQFPNPSEACAEGNIAMNHRNQLNAVGSFKMLDVNNDVDAMDYI